MLRLIALVVAVTCSLLPAAPVPKPTDRELKAQWGDIVKGDNDDRDSFRNGQLTLVAAPRKLIGCGLLPEETNTPLRTSHAVNGDFNASVRLVMNRMSPTNRAAEIPAGGWSAGLYAKDRNGYVVIPWRGEVRKMTRLVFDFEWSITGQSSGRHCMSGGTAFDGVALSLRLQRHNGILSGALTGDGKKWIASAKVVITSSIRLDDVVEVGLFVSSHEAGTITATFSDFKLTTGKK